MRGGERVTLGALLSVQRSMFLSPLPSPAPQSCEDGGLTGYEHLEYSPIVNARQHQLGDSRLIQNQQLREQYAKFLNVSGPSAATWGCPMCVCLCASLSVPVPPVGFHGCASRTRVPRGVKARKQHFTDHPPPPRTHTRCR
jgi:hypothetical protein